MQNESVSDFDIWIHNSTPSWRWDWPHQALIYLRLREMTDGTTKRLMIFMPPRHSKSETVTVRYTAWRIIRDPNIKVILGSYNQRLANRFSRKIRRFVEEQTSLSKERKAADEWETLAGGGICAVGCGAGVTGYGADLIIIDDPVKNRQQAESKTYRENVYDWFNDDIYTRLEPNAAIILIQTRWHQDDLAGRLLKEMAEGGEQWEVLSLPALAETYDATGRPIEDPLLREEGEALCPDRFSSEALLNIKRRLGGNSFAALYQQNPVPREGGIFKREWFTRIVNEPPKNLLWFRAYDLAVSTKTSADYTASFRCALDEKTGDLYIADGFRERIEFPDQRRYLIERIEQEKDTSHGIESALHGKALVQEVLRQRRFARRSIRSIKADKDKLTRALSWTDRAREGKVVLVRGNWINDFLDEVCHFPDSRHDDQVDAVSLAVTMIAETSARGQARGF